MRRRLLRPDEQESQRGVGIELGQALHRLGVRVSLFSVGGGVGPLSDPVVRNYATQILGAEFPFHPDAKVDSVERDGDDVVISRRDGAGKTVRERFEWLLAATGRRSNLDRMNLDASELALDERGLPEYDRLSLQCGDSPVFVAGDANGDLPLLHEAADEGRVAGENAGRYPTVLRKPRRTPLGIMFSDPQIAVVGESHADLEKRDADFCCGEVSFEDQGRARVFARAKGLLRVYGEESTGRLLGAEMIAPDAEHLAHLLAWSIQSRLTVNEVLERPFYHPVLEEGVRTALRTLDNALGMQTPPPPRCIDCGPGG